MTHITHYLNPADVAAAVGHPLQHGGVTVFKAPPGAGKSHVTREVIRTLMGAGQLQRVLWAVQATRDPASLGAECLKAFQAHSVRADLVHGQDAFTGRGRQRDYAAQMVWPDEPAVKIISFAHLPLLFGPDPSNVFTSLQKPDLLVIDETPHGALLFSSSEHKASGQFMARPLNQKNLERHAAQSRICARLVVLLRQADSRFHPDLLSWLDVTETTWTRSWTGTDFLRQLGMTWMDADWTDFTMALSALRIPWAPVVTDALRHDLSHPEDNSQRFGVHWKTGLRSQSPEVRFDVRLPLPGLPPTLALDAYGEQDFYTALFADHPVHLFTAGTPHTLDIEWLDHLKLDALNLEKGMDEKHLQIAEEVVDLLVRDPLRGVVVLTNKAMAQPGSAWEGYLKRALQLAGNLPQQAQIRSMYFHAGRGINACCGDHAFALVEPKLPRAHREHTTAALFPESAEQRKWAHEYLEQAELLQMLERVRQAQNPGARIITAFEPSLPPDLARVRPYSPSRRFVRKSSNPRLRDALSTVGAELLAVLDGIPLHALYALGLLECDDLAMPLDTLKGYLRDALVGQRLGPELSHWVTHGELYRYSTVPPYRGSKRDEPLSVLQPLGVFKQRPVRRMVGRAKVQVAGYAPSETAFQAAVDRLFGPSGSPVRKLSRSRHVRRAGTTRAETAQGCV
ncbi:hypothetical protein LAJ19_03270 [Deinococcus taeanensis]|uniref:hypothetical protein n=1 Tax=Deinococcus taeanensis TaxID=2737050 RepID=UPI001CDC7FB4|nr:hypothetical protein [Deinococcus taeanensis]UBV43251.1 hypothetical protein LAJ19_03270 [Deinococcus taeanensis]